MAKGPKVRTRAGGKKKARQNPPSKKWQAFQVNGNDVKRLLKTCPKCGAGVYLANHANRESCGKCGYTQFKKQLS